MKLYGDEPGAADVRRRWSGPGTLAHGAGDLAERHKFRGFDALHLASYLAFAREFPDEDVRFSSADRALERAARLARRRRRS